MESRTIATFGIVAVILAAVVVAFGTIPSNAFSGGNPVTVCNLNMTIGGVFNDYGITRDVSGFTFISGATGCHTQTLLDLALIPPFNIFPETIHFSITLMNQEDGSIHGPYNNGISIPALSYAFPFSHTITVPNVPTGQYTVTITSGIPFTSSGGSSYTTTITVS